MIDDVLAIPDHLLDALWRLESARLEPADAAGVMVCGMGGSAIGGDLAAAALGDRLTRPLITVRGYELPSWVTPEWTLLCSSYSGATEETLACFAAGEALGARRIVASTGGPLVEAARQAGVPVVGLPGIFAPRAAVAYMVGSPPRWRRWRAWPRACIPSWTPPRPSSRPDPRSSSPAEEIAANSPTPSPSSTGPT